RTGRWPAVKSGPIPEAPGETWVAVDQALRMGARGLPGGSSLAGLLLKRRGVRNPAALPRLSEEQILHWADAHFQRTGRWPKYDDGPIVGVEGETWGAVQNALRSGRRGLQGGSSLARFLAANGRGPARRSENTARLAVN